MALLLAGTTIVPASYAQRAAPGVSPHVDLGAALNSTGQTAGRSFGAALSPKVVTTPPAQPGDELFEDVPAPERGWKGLARVLEALSPNVDTSIPLTPSEVTDRIAAMMNSGQYAAALDIIERRAAQRKAEGTIGTDVQLMFLRGRALAGLERHDEAIEHYLNMTTLFPELPEPWNNLAVEYVRQGNLEMANDALQMALAANPQYATARANLGWVQLMQARQSFQAADGAPGANQAAQETTELLNR